MLESSDRESSLSKAVLAKVPILSATCLMYKADDDIILTKSGLYPTSLLTIMFGE